MRKVIFILLLWSSLAISAQELKLIENRRHLISHKLEGNWKIHTPITQHLRNLEDFHIKEVSFRKDPKILKNLPPDFVKDLARFPLYLAGHLSIHMVKGGKEAKHDLEFVIAEYSGHPWLLYLQKEKGKYVDIESNYIYIVSAEDSKNDLLFIGGDNPREAFTALERK